VYINLITHKQQVTQNRAYLKAKQIVLVTFSDFSAIYCWSACSRSCNVIAFDTNRKRMTTLYNYYRLMLKLALSRTPFPRYSDRFIGWKLQIFLTSFSALGRDDTFLISVKTLQNLKLVLCGASNEGFVILACTVLVYNRRGWWTDGQTPRR